MREIDITKQDVRCYDDFYVEMGYVDVAYELWFEVDKYFGTDTSADDTWLNFYTYYNIDGTVSAVYEIDSDGGNESFDWPLTEEEKVFFKTLMEEYCQKRCGCTLDELVLEGLDQ